MPMKEIVLHGRGGQGVVTSAELIAVTAIAKGKFAQAFPSFGPERRGAPVVAFSRIDDKRIYTRSKILNPDIVIVLDSGLLSIVNPAFGIKPDGILIINTSKSPDGIRDTFEYRCRIATVDAQKIATEELGKPIANTTMLGAFLRVTDFFSIGDIEDPILSRFGDELGARNMRALKRAFKAVAVKE